MYTQRIITGKIKMQNGEFIMFLWKSKRIDIKQENVWEEKNKIIQKN